MAQNPFYLSVLPVDAPFCGREKELNDLVSHAESNANVVLYSPRRYGKTSLIKRVQDQLEQKGFITIYIDILGASSCEEIASMIAFGIYNFAKREKSIMNKVVSIVRAWRPVFTLDQSGQVGMSFSIERASENRGIALLEETMKSFDKVLADNDQKFNVVIDEFQEIANAKEGNVKEGNRVEALLRKYIQHQFNVSYFFLGSRRRLLIDMFNQKERPFYRSCINFKLPPLAKDKTIDFVREQFGVDEKDEWKCPSGIAEQIANITGCYPYYVQRLSYAVFEVAHGNKITAHEFEEGINKMLEEEGINFDNMERILAAGQKALLKAFASEPTAKPFAVAYKQRHRLGSLSSRQSAIKKLESLDYIERDKDNYYCLTDPIFALWINKERSVPYAFGITEE